MATILEPQQRQADQRFVLPGVSWRFYELLLDEIGDRPIRVTYDRGNLELMSPSPAHEIWKTLLGRLIEMLTFELDIPMRSGGSMTFRRGTGARAGARRVLLDRFRLPAADRARVRPAARSAAGPCTGDRI